MKRPKGSRYIIIPPGRCAGLIAFRITACLQDRREVAKNSLSDTTNLINMIRYIVLIGILLAGVIPVQSASYCFDPENGNDKNIGIKEKSDGGAVALISSVHESRKVTLLDKNWLFINQEVPGGESMDLETRNWEHVNVPHDWAISGEFDIENDSVHIQIIEDGDKSKRIRTGLSGALPHVGIGWYRKELDIPLDLKGKRISIEFDGAMSNAKVYMNGMYVGEWPYGYSSFGFDVTKHVNFGGENVLAVRLENKKNSSRWYPGAGLYRNVRQVLTNPVHVKQWGTYVTTPDIESGKGTVNIETTLLNHTGKRANVILETAVLSPSGQVLASLSSGVSGIDTIVEKQSLLVENPELWSPENPSMYSVLTKIKDGSTVIDEYYSPFGFRHFEFTAANGFFINGKNLKLKGVCIHHDLGPLGAAINVSSLHHRLKILKEMGCNALRTAHNPHSPELYAMADTMGFLVINEAFDEWKIGKVANGYSKLWDEWAEKDLVALIHRDRNHPSVIMWSLGNEVREQKSGHEGKEITQFLVDISKREDFTRPTTAGFNHVQASIENGLVAPLDVIGWNYKPGSYKRLHEKHPDWKMYGSETASSFSSRGVYLLPAKERTGNFDQGPPYHVSAYGLDRARWGSLPDREFKAQDECEFIGGEFVWTGFDYLGEPTPFYSQWPARSSYFGIIDLCGIPKDRYFLYQSKWSDNDVLHLLPHWNWNEGDSVPVHCYTSYDKAELFLNGRSQGIREKDDSKLLTTYRLIWENVAFEKGELKVVALDENNNPLKETLKRTASQPASLALEADKKKMTAGDKNLVFITVSVVDENGVLCPVADNLINFSIEGEGELEAVGNGDPTSTESFVKPIRKAFSGKCMVIVRSTGVPGRINLKAGSEGLEEKSYTIVVEEN